MPVSSTVIFEIPERKQFEALPADMYQVQITDITDKLKAPYGKPWDIPDEEKELFITFELTILDEGEYRGRKLWKDMRPVPPSPPEDTKFKPSWMHRLVSAVNGQPMTYANAVNWGVEETNALIGKQLRVTVTRTEKGEKVYNNITEVLPIKQPLEPIEANNAPSEAVESLSGYEKAKAVVNSLQSANRPVQRQNEVVAPDVAEMAEQMRNNEMNVDEISF